MPEPAPPASTVRPGRRGPTVRPAQRYGEHDDDPVVLQALEGTDVATLAARVNVHPLAAAAAVGAGRRRSVTAVAGLLRARPALLPQLQHVHLRTYRRGETPLHIIDAWVAEPVREATPFTLLVRYQNTGAATVVLASVVVEWLGESFVVEQAVGDGDRGADGSDGQVVAIRFDEQRTLPLGPADLTVRLYRADGAAARFRRGVYVLPAGGLAKSTGTSGSAVTRSVYHPNDDEFLVQCPVTVANGADDPVQLERTVRWELRTDGASVEAGSVSWPTAIAVPGLAVWHGTVEVRSPRGSPAFLVYEGGRDLAVVLTSTPAGGPPVTAHTISRTMPHFGVNAITVGTFEAGEDADLAAEMAVVRAIFEGNSFGVDPVDCRRISAVEAGPLVALRSSTAFGDLLEGWTCPDDRIDAFLVQVFDDHGVTARAGRIPGPDVKGGRIDGVAADKMGYELGGGKHLLGGLGKIIAHELGHYLGLEHATAKDNLMYEFSVGRGVHLDDGQRAEIAKRPFVHAAVV